MKKIKYIIVSIVLATLLSSCIIIPLNFRDGNFRYSVSRDGYWNDWSQDYLNSYEIAFYNNHFIIYDRYRHPSEYFIKVSYKHSSEREQGKWYVYDGSVEYYTEKKNDKFAFDKFPNRRYNASNSFKQTSSATIKITKKANKAHKGATINVFFEGNAIGISGVYQ
jgi:hypothetical protein